MRGPGASAYLIPYTLTLLFLLAVSCTRKTPGVELELNGGADRAVAFWEISAEEGAVFIDSVRLDKQGRGRVYLPKDGEGMYALQSGKGEENLLVLFLPPSPTHPLSLQADFTPLVPTARITTPQDTLAQTALIYQQMLLQAQDEIHKTEELWAENRYTTRNVDSLYEVCVQNINAMQETMRTVVQELCGENTHNLLPVFMVNKQLAGKDLFDMENGQDLSFLLDCAQRMQEQQPDNAHVRRFLTTLRRAQAAQRQRTLNPDTDANP